MIGLGPFLIFLIVVAIVVTYMLIVRSFLRQAEGDQPTEPAVKETQQHHEEAGRHSLTPRLH